MSIAVSTVVRPSRLLNVFTILMCTLVLATGGVILCGQIGELAGMTRAIPGGVCIFLSVLVCYRTVQNRKAHHIDISGHGRIRLAEHSETARGASVPSASESSSVSLMADSTLWSCFLLLRLQREDGRVVVLPILPDSIEGGGFRALAIACRWSAAHNHPQDHTQV